GEVTVMSVTSLPEGSWQGQVEFPDRKGYVDDTLAMNSMYSFRGYEDQGILYLTVGEGVQSFDLFINNRRIDTGTFTAGTFAVDYAAVAVNGINTIQVTHIVPQDLAKAVTVSIPYPTVIAGTPAEVGIDEAPLKAIDRIISADVRNGFSSAQLAIIKDGKLVCRKSWGLANSYTPDGRRIDAGPAVTNETLYDLASNTKMYGAAYAVQVLMDRGELSLDEKIVDIIGPEFVDNTIEIRYAGFDGEYPGLATIKEWKAGITVKNVMMHQAGFPDSGHYHNQKFDQVNQGLDQSADNVLYVADANKEKTLREGICRTPLLAKPGTTTLYSDIDYMLLGLVIEKKTGQDLDRFLMETFWGPMGLTHVTYKPLEHGFTNADCAATELNGNTRDGVVDFPGVRRETLQGEVHDEACYYTMEGVSGHAGLFANATDLAKLASVMLTGGYGNTRFFSKDTRDLFIAPQAGGVPDYGIGWWRQGDDRRSWYFGSQAPDSTVGHQGWTGTLTMIDFENDLVVAYLTNAINTPVYEPTSMANANQFSGRYYTASTLGFVPQFLYMGLGAGGRDPQEAIENVLQDMVREKQKLVDQAAEAAGGELPEDHPIRRALQALEEAAQ
ncbi:MAG: serine hydrolase, partial [Clostridia bacterium]|nr:serine hydrolase [Clostridia bacterium]